MEKKKQFIPSSFVKRMEKAGFLEIGRWPMHIPDEQIIREIEKDERWTHYAMMSGGVWLQTHAGVKAWFVNIRPQLHPNQVYSNKEQEVEHLLDQMDSDQSCQAAPFD